MQGKIKKSTKKLASTPKFQSTNQLTIPGFETTFERQLLKANRWVKLGNLIPWDLLVSKYDHLFKSKEGRPPLSGRLVIGAVMIKHILNISDRETIAQISENIYMQYFLGYSSYTTDPPFTSPLFVEIRNRLSAEIIADMTSFIQQQALAMNGFISKDELTALTNKKASDVESSNDQGKDTTKLSTQDNEIAMQNQGSNNETVCSPEITQAQPSKHKGKLLLDATVCPQYITFPTDIKLLDRSRRKLEELIDTYYNKNVHIIAKPRTYRQIARQSFLNLSKKKHKNTKEVSKEVGRQLRFIRRNLSHINMLLDSYANCPLSTKDRKYLMVISTVYDQQLEMYQSNMRSIPDRIVNIHQPHVRPMVRGKDQAKTEFGSKIHCSMVNGYVSIDHFSWDAFNEGQYLEESISRYKQKFGFYPEEVLADSIYCTRENRRKLKEQNIKLIAKPLGRQPAVKNHIRPGERNPVEGKFGQAKTAFGLNCIKAKLQNTSESWVMSIVLVLNLVQWARQALYCLIRSIKIIWLEIQNRAQLKMS